MFRLYRSPVSLARSVALVLVHCAAVLWLRPGIATAGADLSPALRFLQAIPRAAKEIAGSAEAVPDDGRMPLLIRFASIPDEGDLAACRSAGLEFEMLPSGEIAAIGALYSGRIAPADLDGLASLDCIARIDTPWRPAVRRPLNLSVVETEAVAMWERADSQQRHLTGQGVIIADLDSGVDVMHPAFFRPDGGVFDWIDVNHNGVFDPGTDAVDLNGNGAADAGETLRFLDGAVYMVPYESGPLHNDGVFDAARDWLYNDANNSSRRDYGASAGFTEASPCYGERLFIVQDSNGNGRLDPGEKLIGLGTSKIRAVYNPYTNQEWHRGTDLIHCETDDDGHGTGVCGILAQDSHGYGRALVGLAPDAELVVVNIFSGIDVGAGNDLARVMGWARNQGARIFLWEIGSIAWDFADGSSLWEQALNDAAAEGIVQVCPAGNFGGGGKHARFDLVNQGRKDMRFRVPPSTEPPWYAAARHAWFNVTWHGGPGEMALRLRRPGGSSIALSNPSGSMQTVELGDNHRAGYVGAQSSRGTSGIFLWVYRGASDQGGQTLATGEWLLEVENASGPQREVDCWVVDDISSWGQGVVWLNDLADAGTIDLPATADSALAVASYSTRGFGVQAGALSTFSGRGPRIDGTEVMDIAAPGNYDIFSALSSTMEGAVHGAYWSFGGTSAAGPHVAAAAALLLQAFPDAGHSEVRQALRSGAAADGWTGSTPNEDWGAGKLRVLAAWEVMGGSDQPGLAGDANVDGVVNILDLVAIVNHILDLQQLTPRGIANADRDGNGAVDVLDLVSVVGIILQQEPLQPAGGPGIADACAATEPGRLVISVSPVERVCAVDLTLRAGNAHAGAGRVPLEVRGPDGWSVWAGMTDAGNLRVVALRIEDLTVGDCAGIPRTTRSGGAGRAGDDPGIQFHLGGLDSGEFTWIAAEAADNLGNRLPLEMRMLPQHGGGSEGEATSARPGVFPNPGSPPLRIVLAGNGQGTDWLDRAGVLDVFDPAGRRVAVVTQAPRDQETWWDGRDAAGRPVPAGVYFVRQTGTRGSGTRLILIR